MKGKETTTQPPVVLLGGTANALSIARSLGRHGVAVYALNDPASHVRFSRYSRWVPLRDEGNVQQAWLAWLCGPASTTLRGAVILPCNDDGLEVVARHRLTLQHHYTMIEADDTVLLAMLDKEQTYLLAEQAGVPTPAMHAIRGLSDVLAVADSLYYPCVLKPRHSHLFQKHFPGLKLFVAKDKPDLLRRYEQVRPLGLDMLITEIIPGPEDAYCSYTSYLNQEGHPLFHFTKRKLRQYPNGFGLGTYHLTDWNPEVAELGLQFFKAVGMQGVGNVEFKRDPRDGRLKLIECNARFTYTQELLRICGIDFSLLVYNHLTGQPLPPVGSYRTGVYAIRPLADARAFWVASRNGELSWLSWLRSLMHRQHFFFFRWTDPWPAIVHTFWFILQQSRKRLLMPLRWQRRKETVAPGAVIDP